MLQGAPGAGVAGQARVVCQADLPCSFRMFLPRSVASAAVGGEECQRCRHGQVMKAVLKLRMTLLPPGTCKYLDRVSFCLAGIRLAGPVGGVCTPARCKQLLARSVCVSQACLLPGGVGLCDAVSAVLLLCCVLQVCSRAPTTRAACCVTPPCSSCWRCLALAHRAG